MMQSTNTLSNTLEKQQLRAMINMQIEAFILSGGRVEILTTAHNPGIKNATNSFPAAPGGSHLPNADDYL